MSAGQSETLSPTLERELIRLAKDKAAENNLPIEKCTSKIVREGSLWVVEFHPSDPRQLGGGGRFLFKIDGDKITFEKMGRWE